MRREQRQAQAVVADQAQTIKSLQIINNRLNDRVVELSKLRRSVSDKYKDMERSRETDTDKWHRDRLRTRQRQRQALVFVCLGLILDILQNKLSDSWKG